MYTNMEVFGFQTISMEHVASGEECMQLCAEDPEYMCRVPPGCVHGSVRVLCPKGLWC